MKLGICGRVTRAFIASPLTPLIVLASFILGAVALAVLPREEEPQIRVPMVDIHVTANGLKAEDAAELVTKPLEDIIKGINAVEHVYSQTMDDHVVVTARFFVGTDEDDAVLRVHEKIRANIDRIPIGIPEPLIVGRGINDVAIVVLTLSPKGPAAERWNDYALGELALKLQHELVKVDNVGLSYIVGGRPNQIRVEPDPERLSLYGVTLNELVSKVENANRSFEAGTIRENDRAVQVLAGQTLTGVPDIGLLLITTRDGRPVYVKDVATVIVGGKPLESRAWTLTRPEPPAETRTGGGKPGAGLSSRPAVSIALAKRKGANAVTIADDVIKRLDMVRGRIVPDDIDIAVTRDYGKTAKDKADELLFHLLMATVTIVAVVVLFIGWREGAVILVVIPETILLTFFASWLMGYTINRVSLFALIFSIGILVDDAIVVVENTVRHWTSDPKGDPAEVAIRAVDEVGNPTIVATLTIIAALLPMMFVSGLMGPYMSPIPANASAAMLFSLFVAVIVTPWLLMRLRRFGRPFGHPSGQGHEASGGAEAHGMGRLYLRVARPLLTGRRRARLFLLGVVAATLAAMVLFATKDVTVKLLPFDNKSEFQVVVDLPEGSALESTERVLTAAADRLAAIPEITSIQAYAGTSAPFNFNGLVRHYYLRNSPELGDLQVNLLAKDERSRPSHAIAIEARNLLAGLPAPDGTAIKVVEVPPGPPVLSTLLAEIYGPDAPSRRAAAARVRQAFEAVDFIVDVDDSAGRPAERLRFAIDQENLEFHGVEEEDVYDTISQLLGGVGVGYSHRGHGAYPIEIAVRLPKDALYLSERLLATPVKAKSGVVELGDVVQVTREQASYPLFRRDGRDIEMVTADLAGRFEAPIYGMFAVEKALGGQDWGPASGNQAGPPVVKYHGQPADESHATLLWDGEWEVTYVTFRDMGAAFLVALLAIYLLLVAQFGNFRLPVVIMVPVPLTLLGIVLGHWLFSAHFTATSMIGFIALAGIIVRNSILLVDFIRTRQKTGAPLRQCLLEAGAIRFRPIFLTAATAMIGAAFILLDPIFQGLAISLLFGLLSSTVLTVLVIPAIYVWLRDDGRGFGTLGD
ncbi:MAG: efflux RND transporter permease subunit [Alphaproteobacteria bacterium]